jgi:hypothetical protein
MDQVTLVDEQLKDGWRLVQRLAHDHFGVVAACWLKTSEDSRWYLYIASPFVDHEGIGKAYRYVQSIIRQMPQPFAIAPLDVKLIGAKSQLAQDIVKVERALPVKILTRYRGPELSNLGAEDAYIYPVSVLANLPPNTTADQETVRLPDRTITLVSAIQQQGDTLVVKRKTITVPPGVEVIEERTETSPTPPGVTKVRYEDE